MKCSICGCENTEHAAFCKKCGVALQNDAAEAHKLPESLIDYTTPEQERKKKIKSRVWFAIGVGMILVLFLSVIIAGRRYADDERDDMDIESDYYIGGGTDGYTNGENDYYVGGGTDNYTDGGITSGTEDWAEAYAEVLRSCMYGVGTSDYRFSLCYISDWNIPNLLLFAGDSRGKLVEIYGWDGSSAEYCGVCGAFGEVNYSEGNNLLWSSTGFTGTTFDYFYKMMSYELVTVDLFSSGENGNEHNGEYLFSQDYYNLLDEYRYNYDWYLASWNFAYEITGESVADLVQNPEAYVSSVLISGDQ